MWWVRTQVRLFLTTNSKHFITLVGSNIYFLTYYWSLPPNFMETLWNFLWMFFPFTFLIVDDSKVPPSYIVFFVCVMSSRILPTLFSINILVTLDFFAFSWKLWTPLIKWYTHTRNWMRVGKLCWEGEWEEILSGFTGHVEYSSREIHHYKLGLLC